MLTANPTGTRTSSGFPLAPMIASATAGGTRTSEYQLLNTNCGAFNSYANTLPKTARGFNAAGLYTYATKSARRI